MKHMVNFNARNLDIIVQWFLGTFTDQLDAGSSGWLLFISLYFPKLDHNPLLLHAQDDGPSLLDLTLWAICENSQKASINNNSTALPLGASYKLLKTVRGRHKLGDVS